MTGTSFRQYGVFVLGVISLTFLAYFPSLLNGFTNWDDPVYLTDNPLVQELTISNFTEIFSTFQIANYHPITLLSLSIEHMLVGLNPFIYHLSNLLLHLLNTWLVIIFVRKLDGQFKVALLAGLIFGIHPMHVESVAWISERKDLLYTLFYLLGLITYIASINRPEGKLNLRYVSLTLLLFLFACLSKGMAVAFPLSLVAIDIFKRRIAVKSILEKVPFFVISIGFGLIAIFAQAYSEAIRLDRLFHFYDRILIICFNVFYYLQQFVLPLKLSPVHPYPEIIPQTWIIYPGILLILAGFLIRYSKRLGNRLVLFGGLFFFSNIILVCQLVPLGSSIVAERYSYLAYLGLCIPTSYYILELHQYLKKKRRFWQKGILVSAVGATMLLLGFTTYEQCLVWHDSVSLWDQALNHYPGSVQALESRGKAFLTIQDYEEAKVDLMEALELEPNASPVLNNLGVVFSKLNQFDVAIDYFSRSININPTVFNSFLGRGHAYFSLGKNRLALNDFDKSILLADANPDGYANRGAVLMELDEKQAGLASLNLALTIEPFHELALLTRANYYSEVDDFPKAINDFKNLLTVSPDHVEALNNLGFICAIQGDYTKAISYFSGALKTKPDYPMGLKNRGLAFLKEKNYQHAITDFDMALKLDKEYGIVYYYRSQAHYEIGDTAKALSDALNAKRLDVDLEEEYLIKLNQHH